MNIHFRKRKSIVFASLWLLFGLMAQAAFGQENVGIFDDVDKMDDVRGRLLPEEIRMIEDHATDLKEFNENVFELHLDAFDRFMNTTLLKPAKSELDANIIGAIADGMLNTSIDLLGEVAPVAKHVINIMHGVGQEMERARKAQVKSTAINWVEQLKTEMTQKFNKQFTTSLRDSLLVYASSLHATDQHRGKFLAKVQRFSRNKQRLLPEIDQIEFDLYKQYLNHVYKKKPELGGYIVMVFKDDFKGTASEGIVRLESPHAGKIVDAIKKLQTYQDGGQSKQRYSSVLDLELPVLVGLGDAIHKEERLYGLVPGYSKKKLSDYYKHDFLQKGKYGLMYPWGTELYKHDEVKELMKFVKENKYMYPTISS